MHGYMYNLYIYRLGVKRLFEINFFEIDQDYMRGILSQRRYDYKRRLTLRGNV